MDTCRAAEGAFSAEAKVVAEGLQDVISGARNEFSLVYPCHSPTERRWFRLLASKTADGDGAVILHFNITPEMLAEEQHAASRVEAERKLSRFERDLEKSSREELRTLDDMSASPSGRSDTDKDIRTTYRSMIDASVAVTGESGDRTLREGARKVAQELAAQRADASDVARLHADVLRSTMRAATRERALWISHESRMVFIGVLGHLANIYRGAGDH